MDDDLMRNACRGVNLARLRRQIEAQVPGFVAFGATPMLDPETGVTGMPDLAVLEERDAERTERDIDTRGVHMAVQVALPGIRRDDIREADYSRAGIPLYVVVDPRHDHRTVTVHSDPEPGPDGVRYRKTVPYAFGDTVTAGRWTLETDGLKAYPADW